MNREVLSKYDVMTVGEALGVTLEQTPLLVDERRHELNMIFHFDVVRLDRQGWRWKPWTLPELKAICARFDKGLDSHSWPTVYLTNHDNPRTVSHFGDDSREYRIPSSKTLATMLLTSKGTPFIYQGDELGMTNYPFTSIEEYDDIEVKNTWKAEVLNNHVSAEDYLDNLRKTSRDHTRTPMQWDDSPNAGFTAGAKTWFAINPNYREINASQALTDERSIYNYYKAIIELRKKTPAFVYGDYEDIDPEHLSLFAYTRRLGAESYLIVLNFSRNELSYTLPGGLKAESLLISNSDSKEENTTVLHMDPWEARVYSLCTLEL
jgi:oligo-1,6-glucosidase